MAARAIGSGTISFGLVSIPVRVFVATQSKTVSFNMLHGECGSRIKQQLFCPSCDRVVERRETVKGHEFEKGRYVTFAPDELKTLEAETNRAMEIVEFVPLDRIDPIFFDQAHYLGPDEGSEKAYHLLAEAMRDTGRVAIAQYASHGKEHIIAIRPVAEGLVMHSLHYADEVRRLADIEPGTMPKLREGEGDLARKLIEQLAVDDFSPEQYHDAYRERVLAAVGDKVDGKEITVTEAPKSSAQVIDLMDALKASLARTSETSRGKSGRAAAAKSVPSRAAKGKSGARAAAGGGRAASGGGTSAKRRKR